MNEIIIHIPDLFSVGEAGQFRDSILDHVANGNVNFVLDFSRCEFIDSTGLGVIVSSYKKCVEAGGDIRLKSLNLNVRKVFELTRLTKVFEIL